MALRPPETIVNSSTFATSAGTTIDLASVNGTGYALYNHVAIGASWTSATASAPFDFTSAHVDAATNIIAPGAHGLITGDKVQLTTTGTLPKGLSLLTDYWAIFVTATSFKLAASAADASAGTAVNIIEDTHTLTPTTVTNKTFASSDITLVTDIIAVAAHGYVDGQKVQMTTTGWLPKPLALATDYWLIRDGAGTLKVAASLADASTGTQIDIVSDTHTLTPVAAANKAFVDGNVTPGDDTIAIALHGFVDGQKVQLTTDGVLPAGLDLLTDYWVIVVDAGTIKLAASLADAVAGTPKDITAAAGGGNHSVNPIAVAAKTFTDFDTNPSTDVLSVAAHGYPTGQKVALTTAGTLPGGLAATDYWVISTGAGTLKLAATLSDASAGTQKDITSAAGFGTHTIEPVITTVKTFGDFDANSTTDNITITSHGLHDGLQMALTTSGSLPTGLTAGNVWIMVIDPDTIQVATSLVDAVAATQDDITAAAGEGTHTVTAEAAAATVDIEQSLDGTSWYAVASGLGGASTDTTAVASKLWAYTGPCRYVRAYFTITGGRLEDVKVQAGGLVWSD